MKCYFCCVTFYQHIQQMTYKANKSLSFIRRNLQINSKSVKDRAYQSLVRPKLKYCCSVWDPYTTENIYKIEQVQRWAARYTCHRHHNTSSVTEMIHSLDWPTLQERHLQAPTITYFSTCQLTSPRSLATSLFSPTSPCELSEREVTSPSILKVVGALDNYSLVFVIFINFFGQLKDWVGQVLFLVSCPKGQVEKYVNVEACRCLSTTFLLQVTTCMGTS
jgi:hypothetical protein